MGFFLIVCGCLFGYDYVNFCFDCFVDCFVWDFDFGDLYVGGLIDYSDY